MNGNVLLSDIAKKCNVSINTVSKALRGKKGVSEKKRLEIAEVSKQMGYFPNQIALSLRYGTSKTIAIVFDNIVNPYFTTMTSKLHDLLIKNGYAILIFSGIYERLEQSDVLDILSRKVDGIITFIEPTTDVIETLKNMKIPIVLLGRKNENLHIDSVATEDFNGGYLAGKLLVELDCKNIGYIGSPLPIECSKRRLNGLLKALNENSQHYNEENFRFMNEKVIDTDLEILIKNGVDGIFFFNDIMAYSAYSILKKRNIKIPQDIKVIGFDDIQKEFLMPIELTTLTSDQDALVSSTIELLLDKIHGVRNVNDYIYKDFPVSIRHGETT